MAVRQIVTDEEFLRKKCKPVENFDSKLWQLLDDMAETMYKTNGVGLAAIQVGVLRRVVVIDVNDQNGLIELINPEIIKTSGEQDGPEGCLSFPGQYGDVKRPNKVTVKALDRFGKPFTLSGEALLARAFCHETDHLDGKVFIDLARDLYTVEK
ncbi:MAG: peptide deformylase [Oscillospiraceae bacterium]|nr:peptide deformylase [Oscillospiraceae bacterium]